MIQPTVYAYQVKYLVHLQIRHKRTSDKRHFPFVSWRPERKPTFFAHDKNQIHTRALSPKLDTSHLSCFLHSFHITMGETKNTQKVTKAELDHKLKLAAPNREILEDLAVACAKDPSPDNTFQYAFCLSKSTEPSELRYAVSILDGLVKEGYEHQLDCMYGAACALYLLGEYEKARVSRVLSGWVVDAKPVWQTQLN